MKKATQRDQAARVKAYFDRLTPAQKKALRGLRRAIRAAVPRAEEAFGYGVPAFTLHSKPLAYYAAFKEHYSLFPASSAVIRSHRAKLRAYTISKGTIRFHPAQPLPASLIRSIVRARAAEIRHSSTTGSRTSSR